MNRANWPGAMPYVAFWVGIVAVIFTVMHFNTIRDVSRNNAIKVCLEKGKIVEYRSKFSSEIQSCK